MPFYAFYPPSGGGGSNASVGANGVPAPSSSTEVAGVGPDGNLHPLVTDNTGILQVSVTANPLQAVNLTQVGGTAITEGQKPMATSLPVVLPSDQSAIPVSQSGTWSVTASQATGSNLHVQVDSSALPTGASTSALQTTGNTSIATVATNTTDLNNTIGSTAAAVPTKTQMVGGSDGTNLRAFSVDASGRQNVNINGTVPVSGTVTIGSPLGQLAAASSVSVALANENVQDLNVTGQSAQTATVNNILTAASGTAATDLNGYRSASVQIVSTATGGTYIFEGSNDNVNFQTIPVWNQLIATGTPIIAAITSTSSQIVYSFPIVTRYVRLRIATTITGGSIQAFLRASQSSFSPGFQQVAQSTAANLNATVTATNLSSNIAQINAVTPLMGNGVTGTGSLRVTIASDTTTNTNPYLMNQKGLAISNTPVTNNYQSTPVTTSAFVQLIASTTAATTWIDIFDSSGQAMILATGAAASEVNQIYVPPGGGSFSLAVAASTRISIKALTASAISGYILLNMRG